MKAISKCLRHRGWVVVFCALMLVAAAQPCFAQSAEQKPTQTTGAAAEQPIPPAILKELEAMRQRIDQLEAELKAQRAEESSSSKATGKYAEQPAENAGIVNTVFPVKPSAPTTESAPATQEATMATNRVAAPETPAKTEPFSDADWTWLNGNPRTKEIFWDTKFFTPEIRADTNYVIDFNHPTDHSIGGSSELFRSSEVQLEQFGVGGDFHYDNVRARLMTQFGMYSATTPRNDPSPGHGQWDFVSAYRYLAEAYGGYHFNALHGVNVDAGIFLSYIGLFSYYNFDNWAYQPSYVSSNTPWFFNGVRVQIFPTAHLKIEPWFINGWQAYASANHRPGLGGQIKWTPAPWINIISNNYALGRDDLFIPNRRRIHTDDSIEVKYFDRPENGGLDKMAFSLTADAGCEYGGGVSCYGNKAGGPKQSFLGIMAYNRFWFHRDLFGLTLGGGKINNPGRYLVLLPPINGESAVTASTNSPYFTENPGDPYKAWDSSITFDYMPKQYITFRAEYDYRHANVPYWTGRGGITPPGGNTGFPTQFVCQSGVTSGETSLAGAQTACGALGSTVWFPDLRRDESLVDLSIMVKF
ncbi:MAG: outer membrane beta-barrel protein [Candidatus Acidiferrales bacterium]